MSNKQAHLEMIQGVVNRLSHNSFLLKGWSVILVSALFALAAKDSQLLFVYLAYFPAISFWCLDGYFLRQERLFRKLYDHVRGTEESQQTTGYKPVACILRTVSAVPAEAGSKPPAQAGSMRLEVPSINHLEVLLTLTMLLNIRRNHFVRNIARAACKISPRPHPLPPVLLPKQPIFPLQLVGRLPLQFLNQLADR